MNEQIIIMDNWHKQSYKEHQVYKCIHKNIKFTMSADKSGFVFL